MQGLQSRSLQVFPSHPARQKHVFSLQEPCVLQSSGQTVPSAVNAVGSEGVQASVRPACALSTVSSEARAQTNEGMRPAPRPEESGHTQAAQRNAARENSSGLFWPLLCAMLVTTLAAVSPLDRASGDLSAPRTADLPNRTRSWFRPAGGVADCPLDAPVILLKMARAGSSDIVQNLGNALPACRWDAELLHETNEFLSAGDYNKCNDVALAEEQRLFREAMGERSIISHNPVSTAGGCFSFAVERTGDGAMGGLPRLEELLEEHMPRRGVTIAWIRHNALRAAVSDHWMAVSGTVHSDGGTRSSTHYPKWGAPVRDIVLATVRWQCNTRLLLETVGAAC